MKRRNGEHRRALKAAEVQDFLRQYGRRAQKGVEPNDRRFDRDIERKIARMAPLQLDRLMREDE